MYEKYELFWASAVDMLVRDMLFSSETKCEKIFVSK